MPDGFWTLGQQNEIKFVLDDSNGNEVSGLGTAWTIQVSLPGNNSFQASDGAATKAEIGNGWYYYLSTAVEASAQGDVAIRITHGSIRQQNLVYTVQAHPPRAILFPYRVEDGSAQPIAGVDVIFFTEAAMTNAVWRGITDFLGETRDTHGNQPYLDPGTYFVRRTHPQYSFNNPDMEVVP